MNNAQFIIALLKCPGVGSTKAFKYICNNKFSLEKCYLNIETLIAKNEFDFYLEEAKKEIELNKKQEIDIISILDERFPSKLYTITDPVLYLYYRGDILLLNEPSIAIIGTRHPSEESISMTKIITKEISNKYVIVSGLALGIDTIGHSITLENRGRTIAVLPSGIDNIQPSSNKKLAKNISENNGLIVSEYSVGTILSKFNYAKRDRIQTALSNVLVVPEAKENSGTMIAVNKAYKEGKKVYQLKQNNNKIIKDSFSVEDNYIEILEDTISTDLKLELNKKQRIFESGNNEQISFF